MSLQINNLEELRGLLQTTKLEIRNPDDLQELLLSIQSQSHSPEVRQQELLALERRQQQRLEHQAHLESLKVAKKGVQSSESIGVSVPFIAFAAATAATFFLNDKLDLSAAGIAIISVLWGTTGLVSLLAVIMATATSRKKVTGLLQTLQENSDSQMSSPAAHNKETIVETGAYSS